MKRIFLLQVLLAAGLSAQIITDASASNPTCEGRFIQAVIGVDSLNTYYTRAFSFGGFDGESFYTYPVFYAKLTYSAKGTPKVTAHVQGWMGDAGWITIDTIATADSVETAASGYLDLNNKHYPQYRLKVFGATSNRRDTQYTIGLYVPWTRKD